MSEGPLFQGTKYDAPRYSRSRAAMLLKMTQRELMKIVSHTPLSWNDFARAALAAGVPWTATGFAVFVPRDWTAYTPAQYVRVHPDIRRGEPQVRGVETAVIDERWDSGELIDEIARDYGLFEEEVTEALAFERWAPVSHIRRLDEEQRWRRSHVLHPRP